MLHVNEVHIWQSHVNVSNDIYNRLKENLAPEEISRLNQLHQTIDKKRLILARGGIKLLLSEYLGILPASIRFDYNKFGKPYLKDSTIQFNISHSGDTLLYAISNQVPVGIDVEKIQYDLEFLKIAQEFCTEAELYKLSNLSSAEQIKAFYCCWTRKEALIKALGFGLYFPLKNIEVNFLPFEEPKLLNILTEKTACEDFNLALNLAYKNPEDWQIKDITLEPEMASEITNDKTNEKIEYAASIATLKTAKNIEFFKCNYN